MIKNLPFRVMVLIEMSLRTKYYPILFCFTTRKKENTKMNYNTSSVG